MQIDDYLFLAGLSSVVAYAPSGNERCGTCHVIIENATDYGDYDGDRLVLSILLRRRCFWSLSTLHSPSPYFTPVPSGFLS